ncbi:MAG: hypothetical protein RJQ14_09645 [Marinoscillum sp.]
MHRFIPGLLVLIFGCGDSPDHIIHKHHQMVGDLSGIENITAFANCSNSDGIYTTYTESSFQDDYLLFQQEYAFKKNPFYALILSKEEGYGLDTLLTSQGPLSDPVIAVLKAHEFHEMMLQPEDRYFGMKQIEDTLFFNQKCLQLIASDHLGLPVRLFFDKTSKLMAGIAQSNPYKKGEIIRVHFEGWFVRDQIKLFHTVRVMQGESDEYILEYKNITINNPDFNKIEL